MIDRAIALPQILLAILAWLLQHVLNPQPFVMPAEITNAAKSIAVNANKWGDVADCFLTWHLPAVFFLGVVVTIIITARRRNQNC